MDAPVQRMSSALGGRQNSAANGAAPGEIPVIVQPTLVPSGGNKITSHYTTRVLLPKDYINAKKYELVGRTCHPNISESGSIESSSVASCMDLDPLCAFLAAFYTRYAEGLHDYIGNTCVRVAECICPHTRN
jgi:hypothetical protein